MNLNFKKIFKNEKNKKDYFLFISFGLVLILNLFLFTKFVSSQKQEKPLKLQKAPMGNQYLYQSKSKGFAVYLGNRSKEQIPVIKFAVENSSIDFKPEGGIYDQTRLTKQDEKSIIYKDAYPGVDFLYTLIKNGIKEEIIIHNQQAAFDNPQFTFKLNLQNAVPQKDLMNDNSAVTFVDSVSGGYLFHFEKPFMIDSGGNRSNNVTLKIQRNSDNVNPTSFSLVLAPDPNWLKMALFPVIIDPTVVLDNANTVGDWTSSDSDTFPISQDTSDKQEGTGSIKAIARTPGETYSDYEYGGYFVKKFTSSGTFTVPLGVTSVDPLVVGGGGGGGNATTESTSGGGGGAGGLIYETGYSVVSEEELSVTIGNGGAAGNDGQDSVFDNLRALGGGKGGAYNTNGSSGGSGGGGGSSYKAGPRTGGSGLQPASEDGGFGYNGGSGYRDDSAYANGAGGGGGGAGAVGSNGAYRVGGNGGTGKDYSSIFGTSYGVSGWFAGGGGGGNYFTAGSGGQGGGGAGCTGSGSATAGTANTGGGGGGDGNRYNNYAAAGGSGIVLVRWLKTDSLNETITTDLGSGNEKDLTGYTNLKFWIKSTRTGTYLQFGMGETAWDNNTTDVTIISADTWEEKTWDISGIADASKDAIRYLGFKVTNADTDFTMKFDDIKIVNLPPTAPTSLLTEGSTNPSGVADTTPEFSAVYNDDANDIANKYQIQVDDDSEFGSALWDSGASGTAMSNCNQGERCQDITYAGSALSGATTYYWRIKYWDEEGDEGAWSTEEAYFSVNYPPLAPTSLLTEGSTNPSGVTDTTPEFSAVYNDDDVGDIANYYQIQVDDDPVFGSTLWDSTKTSLSPTCTAGNRCTDISYGGTSSDLQWNTKYYWRIKYWDDGGLEGAWSTETAHFTMSPIYEPTSCMIDDSGQSTQLIVKWSDNTILETGYRIERSVDGDNWTLLSTEAINSTYKVDETVSSGYTYVYRIRANSDNGNSQWCSTSQVDYHKGNLQMQGIIVE